MYTYNYYNNVDHVNYYYDTARPTLHDDLFCIIDNYRRNNTTCTCI